MGKSNGNGQIVMRYLLISAFILLWATGSLVFLTKNSLVDSIDWNNRADTMYHEKTVQPIRGDILARDGSILATNQMLYDVAIMYRDIKNDTLFISNLPKLVACLAKHFPNLTKEEWSDSILKEFKTEKSKRRKYVRILKDLTYDQYQLVNTFPLIHSTKDSAFKSRTAAGITIDPKTDRFYPCGNLAKRSIGAVGFVPDEGNTKNKYRKYGLYGLEGALDTLLYGKPGIKKPTIATRGMKYWVDQAPVNGYSVKTTIDLRLQDMLDNAILSELEVQERKPQNVVAILMDVPTGDILAVSNYDHVGGEYVEAMNYAFRSRYDPGSLLKTLTLLVALEDGFLHDINTMLPVTPIMGQHASHLGAAKAATAKDIIRASSNTGMIHMMFSTQNKYKEDPSLYIERLRSMGLMEPMEPLEIGIFGAVPLGYPRRKITALDFSQMAYGYNLDFPPIMMAAIYNAVANDGKFVRPRLYTELIGEDTIIHKDVTYIRDRICSSEHARQIREAWRAVVTDGTGRRMQNSVVPIAGKTGTAQVLINNVYRDDHWRFTFAGCFPYDTPKYTIYVMFNDVNIPANSISVGRTSGQVILRMMDSMYANGYLSDEPIEENPKEKGAAKVFRTRDAGAYAATQAVTGVKMPKESSDTIGRGTVPNVMAMGLTEALSILERRGYNVTVTGAGFVSEQYPAAGTKFAKGGTVTITLKQ